MPLDHADYAERRLREDNAKLKAALEQTVQQLRILLASLEYDDRPSWSQLNQARRIADEAKNLL